MKNAAKGFHDEPFWFCSFGGCEGVCKECINDCEMSILVKARKEMAENILRKLKERVKTRYALLGMHTCYGDIEFEIDNLANEIGVEIKEELNNDI